MHYINSRQLSRRHLLKGIGATMALPFLEAMGAPTKTASSSLATGPNGQSIRYGAIFMPNGAYPESFNPAGATLDKLPPVLQPLGDMAKHSNVITGLSTSFGGHVASTAGFLTGNKPLSEKKSNELNIGNPSIDQIIGNSARGQCPLPTLELALHKPRRGISPSGYPWAYANFVSWKDGKTPVLQEVNPMRAFLRLFKNARPSSSKPIKKKQQTGFEPGGKVVDAILEDAKQLEQRLGIADKQKLDEYLTAVNDVQTRIIGEVNAVRDAENAKNSNYIITDEMFAQIQTTKSMLEKGDTKGELSAQPKLPYPTYIKMMFDIMALAFWSNSTRASTLMLGDGGSKRNMSFLDGVSGDHHSISHHGNKDTKRDQYNLINTFFVEQYTYFIRKLQSMEEAGSNVLENSIIIMGSGFGNGQVHSKTNIPMIVSGTAGGKIKTNRHIQAPRKANVGTFHRSMLDYMNINADPLNGKGMLDI